MLDIKADNHWGIEVKTTVAKQPIVLWCGYILFVVP